MSERWQRRDVITALATLAGGLAASAATQASGKPSADVTLWSAAELSAAVRARKISSVELMSAYWQRVDALNPRFNALVSLRDPGEVIAEARAADEASARGEYRGWLHGLPQAPKDLADAAGLPTTLGFAPFRERIAQSDSIHIARARKAGAIVIGKSNTPDFGLGSHTVNPLFGATRNAWNPDKSSGGSSGGAAVALALRMLPVADGSDFMGSLRNPAGWNNVIGMRPTPGLVPLDDSFMEALPCNGPMARTVTDLALLLATQAGEHRDAPAALPGQAGRFEILPEGTNGRPFRIGWLADWAAQLPITSTVLASCERALASLQGDGFVVESASLAFSRDQLWTSFCQLRHWLTRGRLQAIAEHPQWSLQLSAKARWEIAEGAKLSADAIFSASKTRSEFYRSLLPLLDRYDALALPSAQCAPFDIDLDWPSEVAGHRMDSYHRWMEVVVPGTLSGCPVINMPAGFDVNGLPVGLQLIGRRYRDHELLQLARTYELRSRWNLDYQSPFA